MSKKKKKMSFDETKLFVLTVKSQKETNMFKILCKVVTCAYDQLYLQILKNQFTRFQNTAV